MPMQTWTCGTPGPLGRRERGQLRRLADHHVRSPALDRLDARRAAPPGRRSARTPRGSRCRRPPRTTGSGRLAITGPMTSGGASAKGSWANPARRHGVGVRRGRGHPYLVARRDGMARAKGRPAGRSGRRWRWWRRAPAWAERSTASGAMSPLALPCMSLPVVAEVVRSGFVEGHHHGSVVALDADGLGRLVGRRRRVAPCCRARATSRCRLWAWCASVSTSSRSCWPWRARRTRARTSTSPAYDASSRRAASTSPRCRRLRTTRSTTPLATRSSERAASSSRC